jgi:hypothetical protein
MRFSAGSVWENNGIYDGKILSAVPWAMQAEGSVKRMCEQHEQKERGRKK